ncbi:hypothetical protein SLA2020_475770 [Shorea laevis]
MHDLPDTQILLIIFFIDQFCNSLNYASDYQSASLYRWGIAMVVLAYRITKQKYWGLFAVKPSVQYMKTEYPHGQPPNKLFYSTALILDYRIKK